MFDKDAIQELSKAQAIQSANAAIDRKSTGALALPSDMQLHDLEKFMPLRRRARGTMTTSAILNFADYVTANAESGAAIFIEPEMMTATAVLNLGGPTNPGHADNIARLEQKRTAAYDALRKIATGTGLTQATIAEFMEDWFDCIQCFNGDEVVAVKQATAAVRKITIESLRKLDTEVQQLSASRSAFESIAAKSTETLPTHIHVTCAPYKDIAVRTFVLRLGILLAKEAPTITLRIVKIEEHEEQMAEEYAERITSPMAGYSIPVLLGKYSVK